jgi:hypothetical protein
VDDGNSDNNFDPVADQTVTATTTDNETAGFTIVESGGNTTVTEAGSTDTFTVVLNAKPDTDVVLSVTSSDIGEAIAATTLTFTTNNWNTPQTVTVTGSDDNLVDGNQTTNVTIAVNAPNSDNKFDAVPAKVVATTTLDDDSASFSVEQTGGTTTVSEDETADTFSIVLNVQPASNVLFRITAVDISESSLQISTVTFTPQDWNTPQTVTVTGVDDELPDGDQSEQVQIAVIENMSSAEFLQLESQSITVINLDNENDQDGDGLEDEDDPCPEDEDCDDDTVLDPDEEIGCVKTVDCDGDSVLDGDEEAGCSIVVDCDGDSVEDPDEEPGCTKIVDCDEDGLSDGDEPEGCGTDPDCDDDGLLDGVELTGCVQDSDCDDDNLPDGSEPSGCILFPDCDGDELLDGFELSRCIFDPDCDDDGLLDGEEEFSCITLNDCDEDGLPDGEEPEGCVLNPDCDGGGLLDGEEPEGCVLDPECGETVEEPVNTTEEEVPLAPNSTSEDPTPTPEDPVPIPEDPTPEPTATPEPDKPEVVTLVAEFPTTGTFATTTFIWGITAGVAALLLLLLLFRQGRKPFVLEITIHTGTGSSQISTLSARATTRLYSRIRHRASAVFETRHLSITTVQEPHSQRTKKLFAGRNFIISFTNEEASELSFGIEQKSLDTEQPFTFMTSSLPALSEKHTHTIEVSQWSKSLDEGSIPVLLQGQITGVNWAIPSRGRTPSSYRLEGLTDTNDWKLITEISSTQGDESKSLLDINEYTYVRLRASFHWTTSQPSMAIPVGSIKFIET